jgi:hypothetical protein
MSMILVIAEIEVPDDKKFEGIDTSFRPVYKAFESSAKKYEQER